MKVSDLIQKRVGIISLGCDKNRVDAEKIIANLSNFGFPISPNIEECDILIINTCAFIKPSRDEAIDEIQDAIKRKQNGELEKIIVTGCLNKYVDTLDINVGNNIDLFLPIKDNKEICKKVAELYGLKIDAECNYTNRVITTPSHLAYLKIADGCDNFCTYCTIPYIRGRYVSEPIENLVAEAKMLAKFGVKELILVAQDVTKYGYDLYGQYKIVDLIRELSKIDGLKWIRLMYCYPELMSDELINEIASNKKICKYVDLPLQHISNNILKTMNRRNTKEQAYEIVDKLKEKDISIRSTFIIGFPGETNEDFNEIIEFLKFAKMNNVGFFKYSKEEGTIAYKMENQIEEKEKDRRLKLAEKTQSKIYIKKQREKIGSIIDCIVDFYDEENNIYVGRSMSDAYEIDSVVYFTSEDVVNAGDIVQINVVDCEYIDLIGEKV